MMFLKIKGKISKREVTFGFKGGGRLAVRGIISKSNNTPTNAFKLPNAHNCSV